MTETVKRRLVAVEAYAETGRIQDCPPVVLASDYSALEQELEAARRETQKLEGDLLEECTKRVEAEANVRNLERINRALGEVVERQWQPIETAPKDGTRILAYGRPMQSLHFGAYETRWEPYGEGSIAYEWFKAGTGPEGAFRYIESDWTCSWKPTHWQPIPAPPGAGT